jgi:hypothetical protein
MKFNFEYFTIEKSELYFGVAYFVLKTGPLRDDVKNDTSKPPVFFYPDPTGKEDVKLPADMRFMFLPNRKPGERDVIYASGQAGAGKSYLMDAFSVIYHRLFPKHRILFFSKNDFHGDISLTHDIYRPINLDKFTEELEHTDFAEGHQFKNSLIVMDDIGAIRKEKNKEKSLWLFIDMVLENMRKKNVSIYIISHVPTNYKQTAVLIREVHHYIVYPMAQQVSSDRMLSKYLGLNSRAINRIVNEHDSRWVDIDCRRKLILTDNRISTIEFCSR